MINKKKAAQQASPKDTHLHRLNLADALATAPIKAARVLAFMRRTGYSLNRLEAEWLRDHCLPSTISDFTNNHTLRFEHVPEQVLNKWGKSCLVTRYRLPKSQHKRALALLALIMSKSKSICQALSLPTPTPPLTAHPQTEV